jgi:hypothetical protein
LLKEKTHTLALVQDWSWGSFLVYLFATNGLILELSRNGCPKCQN